MNKPDMLKLKYSFMAALIFFIVSSPETYKLTNKVVKTSVNGCPTTTGLLLHAVVFMVVVYGLMKLKED